MTDVAQILGIAVGKNAPAAAASSSMLPPPPPASHQPPRALKLQSLPREVQGLLSSSGPGDDAKSAELPPAVPSFLPMGATASPTKNASGIASTTAPPDASSAVKVGNKWIAKKRPARPWTWAPFSSSSRTDGALFSHWVRAGVEYPDYPYARFDIHMDPVTYNDEEYRRFLKSDTWTKSETDQLMELTRRFELRWPVVYDRWMGMFPTTQHKIEDLQYRFYSVAALLSQNRISQEAAAEVHAIAASAVTETDDGHRPSAEQLLLESAAARALASSDPQHQPLMSNIGTGTSNKVFDLAYERDRRAHMEALWNRTKEEEAEEAQLRKELKQVEAQLRKVKKAGGHILAAGATGGASGPGGGRAMGSASSSRNPSRSNTPIPGAGGEPPTALLDQAFASTAPTPMPQTPYLQSGRLLPPATGGSAGLNKTLLTRMDTVLEELNIPADPIPTKRVCDLYDAVRKDVLTLLILQKNALQKEGLVQSRRLKLAKLGGSVRVVDEETLLGIAPPPSASAAGVASAPRGQKGGPRGSKTAGKATGAGAASKGKSGKANSSLATDDSNLQTKTTKQAKPTSGGDARPAPGSGPGGKAGGKQARKRKRKSEASKSPAPSATGVAAAAAAAALFAGGTAKAPPAASVMASSKADASAPTGTATAPAGKSAAAGTTTSQVQKVREAPEGKQAKKRARKSTSKADL